MKRVYTGVNGRQVGVDLGKVEAVLEEVEGEVHLFTSGDWYRVRARYEDVLADWQAS